MLAGKGRNVMKYLNSFVSFFYFEQVRSEATAIKMENLQSKKKKRPDYMEGIQLSLDS